MAAFIPYNNTSYNDNVVFNGTPLSTAATAQIFPFVIRYSAPMYNYAESVSPAAEFVEACKHKAHWRPHAPPSPHFGMRARPAQSRPPLRDYYRRREAPRGVDRTRLSDRAHDARQVL